MMSVGRHPTVNSLVVHAAARLRDRNEAISSRSNCVARSWDRMPTRYSVFVVRHSFRASLDYLGPCTIFRLMKLLGRVCAAILFREFEANGRNPFDHREATTFQLLHQLPLA